MRIVKSLLRPALAAVIAASPASAADPELSLAAFDAAMRETD